MRHVGLKAFRRLGAEPNSITIRQPCIVIPGVWGNYVTPFYRPEMLSETAILYCFVLELKETKKITLITVQSPCSQSAVTSDRRGGAATKHSTPTIVKPHGKLAKQQTLR